MHLCLSLGLVPCCHKMPYPSPSLRDVIYELPLGPSHVFIFIKSLKHVLFVIYSNDLNTGLLIPAQHPITVVQTFQ